VAAELAPRFVFRYRYLCELIEVWQDDMGNRLIIAPIVDSEV